MDDQLNSMGAPAAQPSTEGLLSHDAFLEAIDHRHESSQSVALRYRNAVRLEADEGDDVRLKRLLGETSIREGIRIVHLCTHRDVRIDVLDETSLMRTRTLKSIDGCVTTAQCLLRGSRRIVFESGGNTGMALTVYGVRAGLETFLFLPAQNLELLDADTFADERAHVIPVATARQVKRAAAAYASRHGFPRVPEVSWRLQASTFVGCFLLEQLLEGRTYDFLAQSISAAFSPIGIYRMLEPHRARLGRLPAFLGVQQASNCAMVRAWKDGAAAGPAQRVDSTDDLLARVMYDDEPGTYGTFEWLRRILVGTGGDLTTLDRGEFDRWFYTALNGRPLLSRLADQGIEIAVRDGEVLEKTGLMALATIVREIESGGIPAGSRVLVCLTGGTFQPRQGIVPRHAPGGEASVADA